ncbi:MAG: Aldo/keto reductase family protein [Planctomycetes bacterium ADurb.Bin126]|nr:MAG: Aldo/keto reductase family protein [Planctomycetes bacterium ADurb.Bin126]HOD80935.1 aldo/keto reductase [Phycisphaerae bacterium]HQL72017.1 aldo/keto reductase [Phycisphaerae bacterium]
MANQDLSRRDFLQTTAAAAAAAGVGSALPAMAADAPAMDKSKVPSFNEKMEYRRLGKTNLWVSAVCLGGHWKQIDKFAPKAMKSKSWLAVDVKNEQFMANRKAVIDRCMEVGINYVDACTREEVVAYSDAIGPQRRDKMIFGFSWYQEEMRNPKFRTCAKLLETLEKGMKAANLEVVDLWRIVMHERSSSHTEKEVEEMMKALETARKQGKCRFTGLSSHDRPHVAKMIEKYPDIVQVVVMPYTADTKALPTDSLFDVLKKCDVGFLGIKPFSSHSIFKGDGTPDSPHKEADNKLARLAIRYILCNPAVTAPIPGLLTAAQVDNLAQAVIERREKGMMDLAEARELREAMDRSWASLPEGYQWLHDWRYV